MQTFFPHYTKNLSNRAIIRAIKKSIGCLDKRRCGKQRVEAYQIYMILMNLQNGKGYRNHPIVKMWKGYEDLLCVYIYICLKVWERQHDGKNIKMDEYCDLYEWKQTYENFKYGLEYNIPFWFGNKKFHQSHKAMLYYKDPLYYKQFEKYDYIDKYFWPIKLNTIL